MPKTEDFSLLFPNSAMQQLWGSYSIDRRSPLLLVISYYFFERVQLFKQHLETTSQKNLPAEILSEALVHS